jgi:photosystem II stability/assembly factor-like uncharacterized protein
VAVDPTDSSVVYAQTTYLNCSFYSDGYCADPALPQALGVYKSADGGATWVKLDLPADHPVVSLLGIDQQGGLYVWGLAQASLIRSQDGGATWNALPATGLPSAVSALAIDPRDPNHLFAGTRGAGVFEITLAP